MMTSSVQPCREHDTVIRPVLSNVKKPLPNSRRALDCGPQNWCLINTYVPLGCRDVGRICTDLNGKLENINITNWFQTFSALQYSTESFIGMRKYISKTVPIIILIVCVACARVTGFSTSM